MKYFKFSFHHAMLYSILRRDYWTELPDVSFMIPNPVSRQSTKLQEPRVYINLSLKSLYEEKVVYIHYSFIILWRILFT